MKRKYRVVFPFVEAGMGHIVPMESVFHEFKKKYGYQCEIITTSFFRDTNSKGMSFVENELIKEVKLHNKKKWRGKLQFFLMDIFKTKISLSFLFKVKYRKGYKDAINYLTQLQPDLIFHTHFATLYYACDARKKFLIDSKSITFCPDPIIGRQWDKRTDIICLSSENGRKKASNEGFAKVENIPFLLRNDIFLYTKEKEEYRKEVGISIDKFTILISDGAYGAGKIEESVNKLLTSTCQMTIIAICGKNQALYSRLIKKSVPSNITLKVYGFTDQMLTLSAASDIFIGKAGASNLAEVCYFGLPQIINFCATPIEEWIADYYVNDVKSAVYIDSIDLLFQTVEEWINKPVLMNSLIASARQHNQQNGASILADYMWNELLDLDEKPMCKMQSELINE